MSPSNGRTRPLVLCFTIVFLALAVVSLAQDGVSTAGAARTRYLGNRGVFPTSREVAVEDFVNYHRHEIGRPKAGEAVAVDVRWGNDVVSGRREALLQVGLSTALAHDRQQLRPLNLSLVIDRSGSMADDNKLSRVKTALLTLVSQLRATDVLSIVVFDSDTQVLLPAEEVLDRDHVKHLIRGLEPGSSTNLNAGLMLGYKEALKHYRKDSTNRVILLTDGIANRGETDPQRIAEASRSYNDRGIDLSTIGVGLDLNKDLLSTLAKSGRGLFHFVAGSEDIEKVFVKELQSLISPVASEPNLEIEFGHDLRLEKVYGYQPKIRENSVGIKLDNMNSGMTEVVLLRFRPRSQDLDRSQLPVTVRLSYFDLDRNKTVVKTEKSPVSLTEGARGGMLEDSSVAKNYTIALLAQSIHDMAAACEERRYREAEGFLNTSIAKTTNRYPNLEDEDIRRTLTMAQKYQQVLRNQNGDNRDDGDRPLPTPERRFSRGENIIPNGDFALGNWGFSSPNLSYAAPAVNCLWAMGYTIAPRFSSPQLHTLVPSEDYAPPNRPNGNEQVFYANVGGDQSLVVWSTTVNCRPNTTYRINFQATSLSQGREWIPTFEIRVNGERSEPQAGGAGAYSGITMRWDSKGATTAKISIVRMPIPHGGGVIGLSNIVMVPGR